MRSEIACELAGLGCKSRALCQSSGVRAGLLSQLNNCICSQPTGVSARQTCAAPCIIAIARMKTGDGRGNFTHNGAFDKPQAAPQSLKEDVAGIFREPERANLRSWSILPMKISFVKTVTIDHEPTQNGVKSFDGSFHAPSQPGEPCVCPAGAHVQHVDVLFARAFHPSTKGIASEKQTVLEGERHRCPFVSKTTALQLNLIEKFRQRALVGMFEGRIVTMKENTSNIFQTAPDLLARIDETATGEFNFPCVNP